MTDQTRADFEAHFQLTTRQAWTHPDGTYKFPEIQAKWEGYQAGVAKAAHDVFPLESRRQQISAPVAAAAPGAVQETTVPLSRVIEQLQAELPTPEADAPRHWEAYRESWTLRKYVVESCILRIANLAETPK